MKESELLQHIYARAGLLKPFPQVLVGPGDDAAVVATGPSVLLTVDHVVEGAHVAPFTRSGDDQSLDQVARKAIARSVSDIAAMGGSPLCSLATACLPPWFPQSRADVLFDRMNHWAAHFKAPLIGGDIALFPACSQDAPAVLTATLVGTPHPTRGPILRSTARPGDVLCVTGLFGNSFHSGRHLTFSPRITEAEWLASLGPDAPTAMMDVSDGLGRDTARIAAASSVLIEIDAQRIPRHGDCPDWMSALRDGEDYELVFTLPGSADLSKIQSLAPFAITAVGRVGQGPALCMVRTPDGGLTPCQDLGWDHGTSPPSR